MTDLRGVTPTDIRDNWLKFSADGILYGIVSRFPGDIDQASFYVRSLDDRHGFIVAVMSDDTMYSYESPTGWTRVESFSDKQREALSRIGQEMGEITDRISELRMLAERLDIPFHVEMGWSLSGDSSPSWNESWDPSSYC